MAFVAPIVIIILVQLKAMKLICSFLTSFVDQLFLLGLYIKIIVATKITE